LNIATVDGGGFLTAWPFGTTQPLAATMNPNSGLVLATGAIVPLCRPSCTDEFSVFTFGAQVIIDIVGYFRAPQGGYVAAVTAATPLASSGGTAPNISLTGIVATANGGTGLSAPGTAGNVLRSNGANWASSPLQTADIPDLGTSYIKNTTSQQAASN